MIVAANVKAQWGAQARVRACDPMHNRGLVEAVRCRRHGSVRLILVHALVANSAYGGAADGHDAGPRGGIEALFLTQPAVMLAVGSILLKRCGTHTARQAELGTSGTNRCQMPKRAELQSFRLQWKTSAEKEVRLRQTTESAIR